MGVFDDFKTPLDSIPDRQTSVPVPAGEYQAVIASMEKKATKNGDGHYVAITLEIVSAGPAKGRKLFDNLNLWNKNAQAVAIASSAIKEICLAVGAPHADEKLIVGKPLTIKVVVRDDKEGTKQNRIAKYSSIVKAKKGKPVPVPVSPTAEAEEFFGINDQAVIDHANQTDSGADTDEFESPF